MHQSLSLHFSCHPLTNPVSVASAYDKVISTHIIIIIIFFVLFNNIFIIFYDINNLLIFLMRNHLDKTQCLFKENNRSQMRGN